MATASCEEAKKETEKLQEESQNIEKRGLHHSFGGSDWSSHDSGHDHGHHHEHIKTITIEKKYPVPYEVIKKVPYTVEKKVSDIRRGDESKHANRYYLLHHESNFEVLRLAK